MQNTPSPEPRDTKIKRLTMRSMRRGIKEMDLILTDFAARNLTAMSDSALDAYDALLSENDHDIYAWVLGRAPVPETYGDLMAQVMLGAAGIVRA